MKLTGLIWKGEEDRHLTKVDISIERTDADEVAIIGTGEDDADATLYVSVDTAVRMACMLGIAAYAHEIQAHEAAKIAAGDQ
jgi:hypothetical protein